LKTTELQVNRPLNFLHLTTFYPPYSFGGDAMYIYRLSHALGDAGHTVDVIHCVDSYHLLHPAEPDIKFAEHPRVTRHELRSRLKWLSPLATQQTGRPIMKTRRIQEVMNSKAYDVIHYHNVSLLGPKALTMAPANSHAIKMYMTHEHWLVCPMHVLWKFNQRLCEKPECLKCVIKGNRPPQLWRYSGMLEKCSEHVDQFVSPSRFTADMHGRRGFPKRVEHLPYFIDRVDHEWKSPAPRPQERPYFLFVGRLEKIKGVQALIETWEKISDWDLLIAGTGTYENQLKEQAGSNPRIKFLGGLSQTELGTIYVHALACIVPSLTFETFGIIIVEAFARKTPVIVRDLGALPEVVQDSGGGFIFRTDEELLHAINQLGTSPALRNELGNRGYEAFVGQWSREAHLELYFDFLNRTAERKLGVIPWQKQTSRSRAQVNWNHDERTTQSPAVSGVGSF
jgi:glycosyltransferase involved in cell wall biosynthesis